MERYILDKIATMLADEDVTNVTFFTNILNEHVVSFECEGHKFVITCEDIGGVNNETN
jgi:hypothetical protein